MTMGDRIKDRRAALNLTLDDVGKKLGVNRSTVMRYESGKTQRISQRVIAKLAEILDTTPGYLLGVEDENQKTADFDGKVLMLARQMQNLPDDKLDMLNSIIKSMTEIAGKEKTDGN